MCHPLNHNTHILIVPKARPVLVPNKRLPPLVMHLDFRIEAALQFPVVAVRLAAKPAKDAAR